MAVFDELFGVLLMERGTFGLSIRAVGTADIGTYGKSIACSTDRLGRLSFTSFAGPVSTMTGKDIPSSHFKLAHFRVSYKASSAPGTVLF
jgi:hypothetical protein